MNIADAVPLRLSGSPWERGAAQAAVRPDLVAAVRAAADRRRDETAAAMNLDAVSRYLDRQFTFAVDQCAGELAEVRGIAQAFGLDARAVFDGLHAGAVSDLATADGCTAWAARGTEGALLAKNRDIRADLWALQAVMLHVDASHPMRAVLCVGSLGAPGAYSSGMNRAGLAVADTAIRASSHAMGWLRYFAMTRLLWDCATVDEALDFLGSVPHTGGGSLVLADRDGKVAAVEFAGQSARVERAERVTRTNHFVTPGAPSSSGRGDANAATSPARLRFLRTTLEADGVPSTAAAAAELMAAHADDDAALCRHADADRVRTVSTAIFMTQARELVFAPDYPCLGRWQRFSLAAFDD
ncbi:MAG TPA: C45 family peptidase [Burkholderiaceae bacterium]|nr:C45 family peptidase [Burkholderiaceae bacterium]